MNSFILMGAVQSLFITLFILSKKRRVLSDYLLSCLILLFGVVFLIAYLALECGLPDLLLFLTNISLLIAPSLFLYIRSLLHPKESLKPSSLFHYLPYLCSWLYFFSLLTPDQDQRSIDSLFKEPHPGNWPFGFALFYFSELLCIPIYGMGLLRILQKRQRLIQDQYSYSEGVDFRWARILVWITCGVWALIAVPDFLNLYFKWDINVGTPGFALATLFIYYLAYFGIKQTTLFLEAPSREIPPVDGSHLENQGEKVVKEKYRKASLPEETAQEKLQTLEAYMQEEQPFLISKLSIQDLAQMLGMTSHNLSQLINEHLNTSFYDYINQKRVEACQLRMKEGQAENFTMLSIALDCGFNSKSSFNRVFKKVTGQTPSQYLQTLNKKD